MKPPQTENNRKENFLRVAVIFDEPDAWRVLAVWKISLEGDHKVGDDLHAARLQNLTGLAREDARRWAKILVSSQLAFSNGEILPEAGDYVRAKLALDVDPEAKKGAHG